MRATTAVLVLVFALAGCVDATSSGGSGKKLEQGDPGQPTPTAAPVVPGVDPGLPLGSIEGRVLTDEQLPLANASVALIGFNVTAYTESEGRFFFNDVNVGDYFIVARGDGYLEKQMGVQVKEGETTQITFILDAAPRAVPRAEPYAFILSINCARSLRTPAAEEFALQAPLGLWFGGEADSSNMASDPCPIEAVDPKFKRNNTGFLLPTFGLVGGIFEAKWVPSTDLGERLSFNVSLQPLGSKGSWEVEGTSPLKILIKSPDLRAYEAVNPKHTRYTENGGRINYRVDVAPSVTGAAVDVGVAVDQDVDVAITLFYVTEPQDYSKYQAF